MTRPWHDVMLSKRVSGLDLWKYNSPTVVHGICFAEPDMILVFKIFYEVFGGGTRLAMPKTILRARLIVTED